MFVVAIAELRGALDDEVQALARDLGLTAYDVRLKLGAGLPAICLTTPRKEVALDLLAKVRARGHEVVACDAAAVVSSAQMVLMRRFAVDERAITTGEHQLPFDDVFAMICARTKTRIETETETTERKFSMGRAMLSGGLLVTKKVTREERSVTESREHVLYVYRRSGMTPWILHESGTHYEALGADTAPSQIENFQRTVRLFRARAPHAVFDDRLVSRKGPGEAKDIDLLAHLLALMSARLPRETWDERI